PRRLDEEASPVDEGHVTEIDLLLARERVRRRAALQVDGAADHRLDARVDGDRHPLHVELLQAELLLHGRRDALAEIDRVAGGRAVTALERERHGLLPVAERDRAAVLDLLQRALE